MSFGFTRTMSPAARAERERRRKAFRLRNLSISEVSSVDRGASHDATVRLMKRHEPQPQPERNERMEKLQGSRGEAGAFMIAKRAHEAAQEGRLSEFDLNTVMKECARVYFDGSMAKMLDSELGKIFLAPRTLRKSAAEEFELLQQRRPGANGDGVDDPALEGRKLARGIDGLIKSLVSQGHSYDEAVSLVHRAEKALKAEQQGTHAGENSRGQRRMRGANLNDDDGDRDVSGESINSYAPRWSA
jgi:hypothetical protein